MVLSTPLFYCKHLSTNIIVLRTFMVYSMQQSCKIFVEAHFRNMTKGAEHRNIQSHS